ncbi:MAG: hypothetical protein OXF06_07750 [Bacteroidetes bacterium]|nr:hypothetical protein [Bacteroidota bacterium]
MLLTMGIAAFSQAQVSPRLLDFTRPTLEWYQIETEHFKVLFHLDEEGNGASRSAQAAARIAEEIYPPITELYSYEPSQKVHIILKDYEDYSNGAAFFFDNKIEIWAPALDSPLRGAHDWLRNVITHEFTHIVQVQASMKLPRTVPFGYLQVIDYEKVRRPDVLYGFPNAIVSYPIMGLNNPAWLAEGTAQYQDEHLHYDQWDSHRDMLLRTRVLNQKTMTLSELGSFYSKNSHMREGVYNYGFAFTSYLTHKYGTDVVSKITDELGQWGTWRVEKAIESATGIRGQDVYRQWLEELQRSYRDATSPIEDSLVTGSVIEPSGFANYYPRFSPDGSKLAYISNQGEHNSRVSLYVRDLTDHSVVVHNLDFATHDYICSFGHRIRAGVTGGAAWRPDGQALAYARQRTTSEGFLYTDLHVFDLNTERSTPLTRNARGSQPVWNATGTKIAYVPSNDDTSSLTLLAVESGELSPITQFTNGTQVSGPSWDGQWIYYAQLDPGNHGNDIWRIKADGSNPDIVLKTVADERSPIVSDGVLYYASDSNGIYNLYQKSGDQKQQLTQVLGGAFMPSIASDGRIAYADYQWDGYKIALLHEPRTVESEFTYSPPDFITKSIEPHPPHSDEDLQPITYQELSDAVDQQKPIGVDSLSVSSYQADFTSFTVSPVLRLDQYVEREMEGRIRGRAETLWRNLKFGSYISSREVLEGISFFGGVMVGPGSHGGGSFLAPANLLALERDIFLQFDYAKGFRIFPKRWSPQVSIQVYNIQRNVENGLSIEEHPCTACLPEPSTADLTYGLWEGNIFLRSKLNRWTVLELGYKYSPYRVTTNRFYSRELADWIPSSSSRYYIGRSFMANAYVELIRPHRETDMFHTGLKFTASYHRENGRLLEQFDVRDGQLVPIYGNTIFHRLRVDIGAGMRLPGRINGAAHGLNVNMRVSTIFGRTVDSFYFDYFGGLSGARGYPFYGLGGTESLWIQTSWTFPLIPDLKRQIGPIYFDKIFMRLYGDAARVLPESRAFRKDLGAELRIMMGSYYLLPTALFISSTYGLDSYQIQLDDAFISSKPTVEYGRQLLWHFGVLFGFDV